MMPVMLLKADAEKCSSTATMTLATHCKGLWLNEPQQRLTTGLDLQQHTITIPSPSSDVAADDADAATPTYHQKLSAIASFIRKQTDQSSMDTQRERGRERPTSVWKRAGICFVKATHDKMNGLKTHRVTGETCAVKKATTSSHPQLFSVNDMCRENMSYTHAQWHW